MLFLVYLALPPTVVCIFAINNSVFTSPPREGFTLAWFFGTEAPFVGVFHERSIVRAIGASAFVAFWVSALAVAWAPATPSSSSGTNSVAKQCSTC
jgi:spermidine/putrescine transport system permease protein